MRKVPGYAEVIKEIPKIILAERMQNADFLCDQCGAPVEIDWGNHMGMFGGYENTEREMACEYCGTTYKVNPHEFRAYLRNKI